MMNAYDRIYLEKARTALGSMLDYAVYDLGFELEEFWKMFLDSPVSIDFEIGDVSAIAGRSGIELALIVSGIDSYYPKQSQGLDKSEEYWLGWALSYYQWKTGIPFYRITENISIDEILKMYTPYHEMDIQQFCEELSRMRKREKCETNLKKRRIKLGICQSQLAQLTGIPLRTIQQYEQGQKDINRARSEYVIDLAHALYCEPYSLLEEETDVLRERIE